MGQRLYREEDEMHKLKIGLLAISALLIFYVGLCFSLDIYSMADQSTWRCAGGIVALGDSDRDVRQKCGNPIDVAQVQDFGPIWIYQPGQARFMYYLAFQNGKLQRIASAACSNNDPECYDLR
jgi:hypothetical protein